MNKAMIWATHYPLLTTHYPLPITHNPLSITHYSQPIIHYPLPTTHYPLPTTHYPLPTTHYPLPITHNPLSITHYPQPIIHYRLRINRMMLQETPLPEICQSCWSTMTHNKTTLITNLRVDANVQFPLFSFPFSRVCCLVLSFSFHNGYNTAHAISWFNNYYSGSFIGTPRTSVVSRWCRVTLGWWLH